MRLVKIGCGALLLYSLITGCTSYKNIPYFQDLSDSARITALKPTYSDLLIQPDDILNISVVTIDPNANLIFAQSAPSSFPTSNALSNQSGTPSPSLQLPSGSGILVNKLGDVDLPILGKFHLGGLTTKVAEDTIKKRAEIYYNKPTIYVRFGNFKITVLGEVARPGTFVMPNEKVTLFDAIGLAGDLTIFGKRENLLLIRDSADQTKLVRLNLNSKNIVSSYYFYLQKNDVIYVEPSKAKLANLDANQNRNYAIAAAVLSVLIILGTRIN